MPDKDKVTMFENIEPFKCAICNGMFTEGFRWPDGIEVCDECALLHGSYKPRVRRDFKHDG